VSTLKSNPGDFEYFYPTSVLDTLWDILFFWVARMMMLGLYLTGKVPFEVVHLHSRVVDKKGQKMSKSKGNVVNPIEMVDKYGADALRFALVFGAAPGSDIVVSEDKIRGMRNFSNKLWNIGRFIQMSFDTLPDKNAHIPFYEKTMKLTDGKDRQIMEQLNQLVTDVTKNIDEYRFSDATQAIYDFSWHNVADIYIEENKDRLKNGNPEALSVLRHVFLTILKLLHPFMPFVTEAIWKHMPKKHDAPLIISPWPV
jgi:valyl-tRNA synthetase